MPEDASCSRAKSRVARALLRNSRLVMLDEATASVDGSTDELIQRTVRRCFVQMTVLTIAHRIQTIVDSDRVLILRDGRVAEFGRPAELLQREESAFRSLVEESNRQRQRQQRDSE